MYIHNNLIQKMTMHGRATNEKVIEFRFKLGFKQHDITLTKRQLVTPKITKAF